MAKQRRINDPYSWIIGVMDKRTDNIIFSAKNLNFKQFRLASRELKKKFEWDDIMKEKSRSQFIKDFYGGELDFMSYKERKRRYK